MATLRMEGVSTFVARMLATENLNVIFESIPTAMMDMSTRTMHLPIFKEENGEAVNDLFVSHEVGHALWTPAEGWHGAIAVNGLSKDILNVVEDIRIERLMKQKYPGLHGVFSAGYTKLLSNNFFGVDASKVNSLDFLNRLNIKSKTGDLVTATFEDEEKVLFDEAMTVETFEDVKIVTKKIMDYLKMQLQKQQQQAGGKGQPQKGQPQKGQRGQQPQKGQRGQQPQKGQDQGGQEGQQSQGDQGNQDGENEGQGSGDAGNEEGQDQQERQSNEVSASLDPNGNLVIVIATDRHARKQEAGMVEIGETKYVAVPDDFQTVLTKTYAGRGAYIGQYEKFVSENRESVQTLISQFNLHKAAHQQKLQTDNQSGTLDPLKLSSYRFTDNLFKKTTITPRSQNHGIIMVIDGSSSMQGAPFCKSLEYVTILAEFCVRTNIPFEVYGFTSGHSQHFSSKSLGDNTIASTLKMVQLLNSNDKAKTRLQIGQLHELSQNSGSISTVGLNGGTPLEDAMVATAQIIKRFQKQHNLEQIHTILLSDGDGMNCLYTNSNGRQRGKNLIVSVNGNRYKHSSKHGDAEGCFSMIRRLSSTFTTFFFMDYISGPLENYIRPEFQGPKFKTVHKPYGLEAIDYYQRDSFFLIPSKKFDKPAMKDLCRRTGKIIAQYRENSFAKS